ncbi:class I mannose-6-phosphate isomerase [Phytoactinopolyspora endophytica]|uniref:class I mannose-6-phosphate isomerase n=1 Tax=Phytoactinopolyspora endophytica TaxID=1642495 RepID=UPI00101D5AE5|nr:class I mannose-6-phosphate isomerase [Phytoactinopolyspora endophytica]
MSSPPGHVYDPRATYAPAGGGVERGWAAAAAALPDVPCVLAVDGPVILAWDELVRGLGDAVRESGRSISFARTSDALAPWDTILARTSSIALKDDPDFETIPSLQLSDLFDRRPDPAGVVGSDVVEGDVADVRVVIGPGAAFAQHDVLWYADLPKRYAERAVARGSGANLGQGAEDARPTTRRLFYVDWPLLDRHRDAVADGVDRWLDMQEPAAPAHLDNDTLTATLGQLARRPFRTRTWFNSTPWGGHWAQRRLGMQLEAPNTALGYELIAPESGILVGDDGLSAEVPLQLLVSRHPVDVLGARVHRTFGSSFPIRFDYLDTQGGSDLSVHCHPQPEYMRRVFGWPYTQHETYYLMSNSPGSRVFLGLREGVDVDVFAKQAHHAEHHGTEFDIEQYVQTFPADEHQLFLIPAGTPHGSGAGNVVLEISATPYLYSLRLYDWLRTDAMGALRPVHVDHAFTNLDQERTGDAVGRDLVQRPRELRRGPDWRDELIGALPQMFFEIRRLQLDGPTPVRTSTDDGFHVLNVVQGEGVTIEMDNGASHQLAYAETVVVPASVGSYTVRRTGVTTTRVVRSVIRED